MDAFEQEADDEPASTVNEPASIYLPYDPQNWSPLYLYRPQNDVVASIIYQSRSEGIGRIEIGKKIGIDATTKGGNRRVSQSIQAAVNAFPNHIGQYQKMEGKYRMIKYFRKDMEPEAITDLIKRVEEVIGDKCPFKSGDVLKFPGTKLNTLRVSDVTLKRFLIILRLLKEEKVVVTTMKLIRHIQAKEAEEGYPFQIDKKSVSKCLLALGSKRLLKLMDATVVEDNVKRDIDIITLPHIESPNAPEVQEAINKIIAQYHAEGRVFPTGQLRYSTKNRKPDKAPLDVDISAVDHNNMTVLERFALLRYNFTYTQQKEPVPATSTTLEEELEEEDEMTLAAADKSSIVVYDPHANYGLQPKMIRCAVIHELAYHFVYEDPPGPDAPTLYDRFPPGVMHPHEKGTPIERMYVYDPSDNTPYRFVPPQPQYKGAPRGWFMIRDLVGAMPLSVYVLVVKIKRRIPQINEFLSDPLRRHIIINDLPQNLRNLLLTRRVCSSIEHICLILCGCGLMRVAHNIDGSRNSVGSSALFYVSQETHLRDTSTSEKSYAMVTPPIDRYKRYDYRFDRISDVWKYWNHLKAIVFSTPLNVKIDREGEQAEVPDSRRYAFGLIDRGPLTAASDQPVGHVDPAPPNDGCAGFDASIFIHLTRHWDLDSQPDGYADWFIQRWQATTKEARTFVEDRVVNLEKSWSSYINSFMPSNMELAKRNKRTDTPMITQKTLQALTGSMKRRVATIRSESRKPRAFSARTSRVGAVESSEEGEDSSSDLRVGKRKRPFDKVDVLSKRLSSNIRSRFTPKERDMLVLVRAVGFFLNPVHRFWLDPTVMRDVMHEYVPESRSKTVTSLMAAGVREMVRYNRMAHLQHIVKTLCSYSQMLEIRKELEVTNFNDTDAKRKFFMSAFRVAHQLLFEGTEKLPSVHMTDSEFERFFVTKGYAVGQEDSSPASTYPTRSQKPADVYQVQHCVAYNVIMSLLLNDDARIGAQLLETLIEHISAHALSEILERLRTDGLISRHKQSVADANPSVFNSQTTPSVYFRHFFNHRYHNDLVELTRQAAEEPSFDDVHEDDPGQMLKLINYFFTGAGDEVEMEVPNNLVEQYETVDESSLANTTKQLRHLENADLHLESIQINARGGIPPPDLPQLDEVLRKFAHKIPVEALNDPKDIGTFMETMPKADNLHAQQIYKSIENSGVVGRSVGELVRETEINEDDVRRLLETLVSVHVIFECGVDTKRYVLVTNAKCWMVTNHAHGFFVRPWTTTSGDFNPSVLRWMSEGVMFAIHYKPGIRLDELTNLYSFALSPMLLEEILELLEAAGCVRVHSKYITPVTKASPFKGSIERVLVKYVNPAHDGIQRFAQFYRDVPLPQNVYVRRYEDGSVPSSPGKQMQD